MGLRYFNAESTIICLFFLLPFALALKLWYSQSIWVACFTFSLLLSCYFLYQARHRKSIPHEDSADQQWCFVISIQFSLNIYRQDNNFMNLVRAWHDELMYIQSRLINESFEVSSYSAKVSTLKPANSGTVSVWVKQVLCANRNFDFRCHRVPSLNCYVPQK
jgi:hypothetical protein